MINLLTSIFSMLAGEKVELPEVKWQKKWSDFLEENVVFYRALNPSDRQRFEQRALLFLQTTAIEAGQFDVTDEDCLLVAASAVIPVWAFPGWHYFNLKAVYLLPAAFNQSFECGQSDSVMTGMVGTGPLAGKMALCRSALYDGFKNSKDKKNVGIHEFTHLVDMADGKTDGFPAKIMEHSYVIPWFDLIGEKTKAINHRKSNINDYATTNPAEFFAVASEYFFERPKMLQKKHPQLFDALTQIYRQDVLDIADDIKPRKKALCPCGSGKRYKHCCMPKD